MIFIQSQAHHKFRLLLTQNIRSTHPQNKPFDVYRIIVFLN